MGISTHHWTHTLRSARSRYSVAFLGLAYFFKGLSIFQSDTKPTLLGVFNIFYALCRGFMLGAR
jgi:hypothetical protein